MSVFLKTVFRFVNFFLLHTVVCGGLHSLGCEEDKSRYFSTGCSTKQQVQSIACSHVYSKSRQTTINCTRKIKIFYDFNQNFSNIDELRYHNFSNINELRYIITSLILMIWYIITSLILMIWYIITSLILMSWDIS